MMRFLVSFLLATSSLLAQSGTGGNHTFSSSFSGITDGGISSRGWGSALLLPYLPVSVPNVTFPNTSGYTSVTTSSAADLQTKVTNAVCNTVISIPQGASYDMGPSGGLLLPKISCSAGQWVIIQTAGLSWTSGTRIDPSTEVGTMAKLTDSTAAANIVVCALDVACGPFWFHGIELEYAGTSLTTGMVYVGQNDASATYPASVPGPIYFDHSYVHGRFQNITRHCFQLVALNNFAFVDGWVSDCHDSATDSQAFNPYVGGPQLIQNSFIEGATENILSAGSSTSLQSTYGHLIHDLTEQYNWYYRPLQWNANSSGVVDQGGVFWSIKNQHEYKACQRCVLQYSVLQNNWTAAQNGTNFLSDPFTQSANGPYGMIQDTTFQYLHVIGGAAFSTAGGQDTLLLPHQHLQDRVMYSNILVEDTTGANHCSIYPSACPLPLPFLQLTNGITGVIFNHITATTGGTMTGIATVDPSATSDNPIQNLYIANNIIFAGTNGFAVTSKTANVPANINVWWFGPDSSGAPWIHNNVFTGLTLVGTPPSSCATFYVGTQCPTAMTSMGFTNWNSGVGGNYALTPGSTYSASGSNPCNRNADSTGGAADCGADIAGLNSLIPASVTTPPSLWPDSNSGGHITLTPSSLTCNGSNTIAITPTAGSAGGSQFVQSGLDVMVNGTIVVPSPSSTSSLTVVPPAFTSAATVTNTALTANLATITASNGFKPTDSVTVSGTSNGSGALNVSATIISATASQFQFRLTHANISSAADSGTATVTAIPVAVSNFGLPLTASLSCL